MVQIKSVVEDDFDVMAVVKEARHYNMSTRPKKGSLARAYRAVETLHLWNKNIEEKLVKLDRELGRMKRLLNTAGERIEELNARLAAVEGKAKAR